MRFLVDRNLSFRITTHLHEGRHAAPHADDVGLGSAADVDILEFTAHEEALDTGAVIAVGPDVVRVRALPLR